MRRPYALIVPLLSLLLALPRVALAVSPSESPIPDNVTVPASEGGATQLPLGLDMRVWILLLSVLLLLAFVVLIFVLAELGKQRKLIDEMQKYLTDGAKRQGGLPNIDIGREIDRRLNAMRDTWAREQQRTDPQFSPEPRREVPVTPAPVASEPRAVGSTPPPRSEMQELLDIATQASAAPTRNDWEQEYGKYNWRYMALTKGDGLPYVLEPGDKRSPFIGVQLQSQPDYLLVLPSFSYRSLQDPNLQKLFYVQQPAQESYRVLRPARAYAFQDGVYTVDKEGRGALG